MQGISYLIVDWGTTNFRAFAMDDAHQLLSTVEKPLGLLQVTDGEFASALQTTLTDWLGESYVALPIYMAGMVGSAKGWFNVPYAKTPAGKQELAEKALSFTLPWGSAGTIFPGVSYNAEADQHDVMRGEEIQLLGLAKLVNKDNVEAILPGTHSKHARIENGCVKQFSSYLTGEIYSAFSKHMLFSKDWPDAPPFNEESFVKGVVESQQGELSNRVFLAWTHRLFNNLNVAQMPDYLSGLLIGYEMRNTAQEHVYIVGGTSLTKRYEKAAEITGIDTTSVSGNECFLAGMIELVKDINK